MGILKRAFCPSLCFICSEQQQHSTSGHSSKTGANACFTALVRTQPPSSPTLVRVAGVPCLLRYPATRQSISGTDCQEPRCCGVHDERRWCWGSCSCLCFAWVGSAEWEGRG